MVERITTQGADCDYVILQAVVGCYVAGKQSAQPLMQTLSRDRKPDQKFLILLVESR